MRLNHKLRSLLFAVISLLSISTQTLTAKDGTVPPIYLINPFLENNILGLAAPFLAKSSAALMQNPAFASFMPYNDFTFSYKMSLLPDTFVGGVAFNKDLNKKLTVSGNFNLVNVGNVVGLDLQRDFLGSVSSYNSYVLKPAVTFKLKKSQAVSVDTEMFFEELDVPVFKFNIGGSYGKMWVGLGGGKINELAVGVYMKNIAGLFSKKPSPGSFTVNTAASFFDKRFSAGMGLGVRPQDSADPFMLDIGISGLVKRIFRINVGYFVLGPEKQSLNTSLSVNVKNFEFAYGIKNLARQKASYYKSGEVSLGVEQVIGINVYYSTSLVVDTSKMIQTLQRIEKLLSQAETLYVSKKYLEAILIWEEVLRLDKANEQAKTRIDESKTQISKDLQERLIAGRSAYDSKDYMKAMNEYAVALTYDDVNPEALKYIDLSRVKMQEEKENYYNMAEVYLKSGKIDAALQSVNNSLLIDPAFQKAKDLKFVIEEKDKERKQIEEKLAAGEKLLAEGDAAAERRSYDEAAGLYRKSADFGIDEKRISAKISGITARKEDDKKKDKANSIFLQAQTEVNSGNLQKGIGLLAQVLTMYPKHEEAQQLLSQYSAERNTLIKKFSEEALTNYNRQEYLEAQSKWQAASGLDPQNFTITAYLKEVERKISEVYAASIKRADGFEKSGQLVSARKEYKKALSYSPDNVKLKEKIASIDVAITQKFQKQREDGIAAYNAKQYPQALAVFETILKDIDDDPVSIEYRDRINNLLAGDRLYADLQINFQNRNFEQAKKLADQLAVINREYPGLADIQSRLKKELLDLNREEELSKMFQDGVLFFKGREYDKAIAVWSQITNEDPQNELVPEYIDRAYMKKKESEDKDFNDGMVSYNNKDWLSARNLFSAAVAANKDNAKAKEMLNEVNFEIEKWKKQLESSGTVKFVAGTYADAKKDFELLRKIDTNNLLVEEMAYKCDMAIEFKAAADEAAARKDLPAASTALKNILDLNKSDKESEKKYQDILKALSDQKGKLMADATTFYNSGNYFRAIGNWKILIEGNLVKGSERDEVDGYLKQAAKKVDDMVEDLRSKAAAAEDRNELSSAIDQYQQILKITPNDVSARRKISVLSERMDARRAEEGRANRKNTATLFEDGINFYKAENYKKAIEVWKQVLDSDPGNQKAKDYIKRAETKLELMGK